MQVLYPSGRCGCLRAANVALSQSWGPFSNFMLACGWTREKGTMLKGWFSKFLWMLWYFSFPLWTWITIESQCNCWKSKLTTSAVHQGDKTTNCLRHLSSLQLTVWYSKTGYWRRVSFNGAVRKRKGERDENINRVRERTSEWDESDTDGWKCWVK